MPAITNLEVDLLRAFATVAETRSFTRAAERLHRTQSTVSLQLKRLEELLGRQLLTRNARHVGLTGEGEALLGFARQMLEINDRAVARITEPELAGLVRLGTPEDFATVHLPEVLASFARTHPRVVLEVRCDFTLNLLRAFEAGEFDLVLVKRLPQGAADGVAVWREPLVWAAEPAAAWAPDQPLPLVLAPYPCVHRKRALDALDRAGRPWRIGYTSPSLAGTQAAVRAGLGVTVLSKEMVPPGLTALGAAQGFPELEDTEIALHRAPGRVPPGAERLAEHIVRSLGAQGTP